MGPQEKGRAQFVGLKRGPNKPVFPGNNVTEKPGRKVLFASFFLQEKA